VAAEEGQTWEIDIEVRIEVPLITYDIGNYLSHLDGHEMFLP
jgi:hypothetical protein